MGFIVFIIVALCCLAVGAAVYYHFFVAPQEPQHLPVHTPQYVQPAPVQQVHVVAPQVAVYSAPPPPPQPQFYAAPPPAYAPNQVVYAQAPVYNAAPAQAPNGGSGGGMSGASVAVGAAAGLAGGLLVGGLITEASHAHDSAPPPDYHYCKDDDDVYAGDF